MCEAFSCLVLKSGEVKWKFGIDSHTALQEHFGLREIGVSTNKANLKFAKVEYSPRNDNYLKPDEWYLTLDEKIKPVWWTTHDEVAVKRAWKAWKRKLDTILIYKEIVYPFQLKPPKIKKRHLELLRTWRDSVGGSVWDSVGGSVWDSVRDSVRVSVVPSVGGSVWDSVGGYVRVSVGGSVIDPVWDSVRDSVGVSVVDSVWDSVRGSVRDSVGVSVGASMEASVWDSVGGFIYAYIGSFFNLSRDKWKGTDKVKCDGYPFQSAVDLWNDGLVASFDGKLWRIHGGKEASMLWAGKI